MVALAAQVSMLRAMRVTRIMLVIWLFAAAACDGSSANPDSGADANTGLRDVHTKLDVLLVVDNSGGFGEEQLALTANQRELVQLVNRSFPRPISVHIGVISGDMGTGVDYGLIGCDAAGDRGELQDEPRRQGCEPPSDPYMSNDPFNFDPALTKETFECIALLGTNGCSFEQPLEAMKSALDGSNGRNAGFLRADADLLVVIMTDEDDCSVADTSLFDPNAGNRWGPLRSYRCFQHGIVCDQPVDEPGDKTGCHSRADGPLHPVSRYTDFLDGLETGGRRVFVAAIAGTTEDVMVRTSGDGLELGPSCVSSSLGEAAPAVRIRELTEHFAERGLFTSVCADDWSDAALSNVTDWMAGQLGDPCVSTARYGDGSTCVMRRLSDQGPVEIERCPDPASPDGGVTPDPCWRAIENSAYCQDVRGVDAVELEYRSQQPATGDPLELECQ